jgi:methionyl-tRNA formyltransferase
VRVEFKVQFISGGTLTAELADSDADALVQALRKNPDAGTVTANFGGVIGSVLIRCAAVACISVHPL